MVTEPKYVPLDKLQELIRKEGLADVGGLMEETHIQLRNQITQILGKIELAYRRGRTAGLEEAEGEHEVWGKMLITQKATGLHRWTIHMGINSRMLHVSLENYSPYKSHSAAREAARVWMRRLRIKEVTD